MSDVEMFWSWTLLFTSCVNLKDRAERPAKGLLTETIFLFWEISWVPFLKLNRQLFRIKKKYLYHLTDNNTHSHLFIVRKVSTFPTYFAYFLRMKPKESNFDFVQEHAYLYFAIAFLEMSILFSKRENIN